MEPATREAQLVKDATAVMRLMETALVLNGEETCPISELRK
ncbi:hypothetical protein A2U01_0071196, partial [Trifolium medium]|nr:hypothetical protein [Trifolium medium]